MQLDSERRNFDSLGGMLKLIIPIFIELLLQVLVGNIDQMMLSNFNQDSVGAVANANTILNVFMLVFTMISLATTILASQFIGAGRKDKVEEVYSVSVFMNIAFGLLISVMLVALHRPLFSLMRMDARFWDDAGSYMVIVGGFSFLQSLYLTYTAIFRSKRMMNVTMFVSMAMNVVNVIFNYILIYGLWIFPAMGVAGAAIATVLSRVAGVVTLMIIYRRRMPEKIRLRYMRPFPKDMLKRLLAIGLPSAGESFSYQLSQAVLLSVINGFGADSTNAKAYCAIIVQFSYLYCIAVSQAAQICVGYHVGAREYDKADKLTKRLIMTSIVVTAICTTSIYLLHPTILSWFGVSAPVMALCGQVLMIDIVLEMGRSFNSVFIRALQGSGDVRYPIIIGILAMWIISVGLGCFFGIVLGWGLAGVWLGMTLDECSRGIIFAFRWKSGIWKQKTLI
ncbi:MAG: MATE family efflux transporter [Eubacteriales bacterium]|nr:MATE family efflux transporter [Eubacteriales bacterium]MDD3880915.1 MATE family efflux transporter [Eubacteriales bacterium]MDD4511718.1 MATE family efflux transporter [Eubacteriales bacterium]